MKKNQHWKISLISAFLLTVISGCQSKDVSRTANVQTVDTLLVNGQVYTGKHDSAQALDIGICGDSICAIAPSGQHNINANYTVDVSNKIVSPGFIDPHTHTLEELLSEDKNHNLNYLSQGVTTVVNGNDGGGPVAIAQVASQLEQNGIGTNVGLFVGHGSIREQVMGREQRFANPEELAAMSSLMAQAMQQGALGLSSGLYYVPGSYANTEEVVQLAKIASQHQGIYDTHLRDESTFNIGFLKALDEAIDIAKQANIHLHLAHIKALGVDVWGQSLPAVAKVQRAQQQGVSISADQYPWLASGTKLHSAVMPKWVMADSKQAFHQRLNNKTLLPKIRAEIAENIRRRGGPESLLITAFHDTSLVGKTLQEVAQQGKLDAITAAIELVQAGEVRVASFNMSAKDVDYFMVQPWVVTSSDGTNGHPRKYASFAKKYQHYVAEKQLLSVAEFINRSSAQTAQILGLKDRGKIQLGYKADIIVFSPENFKAQASFAQWDQYSTGVEQVFVNGQAVIKDSQYQQILAGKFVH